MGTTRGKKPLPLHGPRDETPKTGKQVAYLHQEDFQLSFGVEHIAQLLVVGGRNTKIIIHQEDAYKCKHLPGHLLIGVNSCKPSAEQWFFFAFGSGVKNLCHNVVVF